MSKVENSKKKRVWKIYPVLFVVSGLYAFIAVYSLAYSIGGSVISLIFALLFGLPGYHNFKKLKQVSKENTIQQTDAARQNDTPQETPNNNHFDTKDHVLDYTFQSYQVAGVSHYKKNIMEVAYENDDYSMTKKQIVDAGMEDEKIWKYEISPLTAVLVPEPDNKHSKNAIQVVIDGLLVGYIPERECLHLLEVIEEDRIMDITAEICGGPYKIVTYDGVDYSTGKDIYAVEKGDYDFSIELTIKEKKKALM